ncbi:protein of unknown function [Cupriavidus taiwanensis]|nr:protein of unknown function [Cupriavidus taiwanensis]SOZ42872.1 protein of unknown function [Cupriavidus taiwanensis]
MVMVVGTSNTLAALASPITLFFMVWRSIDWTPKAICGWWSMMISWLLRGVRTSSLAFDMTILRINSKLLIVCGGAVLLVSRRHVQNYS